MDGAGLLQRFWFVHPAATQACHRGGFPLRHDLDGQRLRPDLHHNRRRDRLGAPRSCRSRSIGSLSKNLLLGPGCGRRSSLLLCVSAGYECPLHSHHLQGGRGMKLKNQRRTQGLDGPTAWGGWVRFFLVAPLIWVVTTSVRPSGGGGKQSAVDLSPGRSLSKLMSSCGMQRPFSSTSSTVRSISLMTALVALIFSTFAAYAFARFRFRGNTVLLMLVVMSPDASRQFDSDSAFPGDPQPGGCWIPTRAWCWSYAGFAIPFLHLAAERIFSLHSRRTWSRPPLIDGCKPSCRSLSTALYCRWPPPAVIAVGIFAFSAGVE